MSETKRSESPGYFQVNFRMRGKERERFERLVAEVNRRRAPGVPRYSPAAVGRIVTGYAVSLWEEGIVKVDDFFIRTDQ